MIYNEGRALRMNHPLRESMKSFWGSVNQSNKYTLKGNSVKVHINKIWRESIDEENPEVITSLYREEFGVSLTDLMGALWTRRRGPYLGRHWAVITGVAIKSIEGPRISTEIVNEYQHFLNYLPEAIRSKDPEWPSPIFGGPVPENHLLLIEAGARREQFGIPYPSANCPLGLRVQRMITDSNKEGLRDHKAIEDAYKAMEERKRDLGLLD